LKLFEVLFLNVFVFIVQWDFSGFIFWWRSS